MEKMIYHDRAAILLHPEPANAGPRQRAASEFHQWLDREKGLPNWAVASMKTTFYSRQPAPAPGTPWHEVASLETSLFAHADGWAAIGKESQYANLLRARLKNTNE